MNGNLSRRNLIKYGAGFIGAGTLATAIGLSPNVIAPQPAVAQNDINSDEALTRLMEGNKRFVQNQRENPNQTLSRVAEVAEGQFPFAAILGCADSRVPTEIVFDQGFGDLFVVRVAGNVATPEEIGSLEFGTLVLGSKIIMVLGHAQCGAVKAAMDGGELPGQVGILINNIKGAVEGLEVQEGEDKVQKAIQANVLYQIERLQNSEVLSELISKGALKIVGAYYDLNTGEVSILT